MAAAAHATAGVARVQAQQGFNWAPLVDHIQINSDDVPRSMEFYQKVMGLDLLRVGPPNDPQCCPDESAFFGVGTRLILAIRKRPGRNIDHWSLLMKGFDQAAVTAELKRRGSGPATHDLPGFYAADPDNVFVQLMGRPGPAGPTPPPPTAKGSSMTFQWAPLIDHMQINSNDVRRSTEYYQKVLGLDLLRVGPPNDRDCCPDESAFFGVGKRLILAVRKAEPAATFDHYALLMNNFDREAVTKEFKARGVETKADRSGFHVVDPDGIKVQLMGQPGPA
jgi:catechol 2,3-dioxygenase-like lactoylglutathione lyase family enzyme